MRRENKRHCYICGEIFYAHTGRDCPDCIASARLLDVPEPEHKGYCICPHDGFDRPIHECDSRRETARRYHAEGKSYQMPQCLDCTEDMPKRTLVEEYRTRKCGWCQKIMEGRRDQVYCSQACANKRRYHNKKRDAGKHCL